MRILLAGLLLVLAGAREPGDAYELRELQGFRVHVERTLLGKDELGLRALELLRVKLYDVERALPAGALAKLRRIPIWLSRADPVSPCACYHPSAEWLREHGHDPRKAKAVEIANAQAFLDWTREQPAMLLHELAHGFHDQVLGQEHAGLRAAFEVATASKKLESVLQANGTRGPAYALGNTNEFFAELSEAWWGTNDFHPFVRAEVLAEFPELAAGLNEWWSE